MAAVLILTTVFASSIKWQSRSSQIRQGGRGPERVRSHNSREEIRMSKEVVAPMPGKVLDILVKEGEEVLEYQDVLVLEAMKMENVIPAIEGGTVKEIKVTKDQTVNTNDVLMILE
jgi:biotin carboxyl carrier protein